MSQKSGTTGEKWWKSGATQPGVKTVKKRGPTWELTPVEMEWARLRHLRPHRRRKVNV